MALIGNYSVLLKSCGRFRSGATVSDNRAAFGTSGAVRGRFTNDGGQTYDRKSATPVGYLPPAAYILPVEAGGMSAAVSGVGSVAASGAMGVNLSGQADGLGSATGAGGLVVSGVGVSAGVGSASGSIVAVLPAVGTATGVGSATGTCSALGWVAASAAGVGSATGEPVGVGFMAGTSTVSGEGLSTANVAAAVWGAGSGDGTYTYAEVLRIVASVTAGKASGGPGSPVFRDLADTKDVVSGTADSNGNRTAVTYDP